jgi:PAS domain S-box-containing protein
MKNGKAFDALQPPSLVPKPVSHSSVGELSTLRQRGEVALQGEPINALHADEPTSSEAMRKLIHELRVHQIELEMQNEELRNAQAALDTAHARYFDFYDLAPVGYLTVSPDGRILQANLTTAALLGVARVKLIRQTFPSFIYRPDADTYYLLCKLVDATGTAQSCELRVVNNGGNRVWVQVQAISVSGDAGATELRLVLTDISERKVAEAAQREIKKFRDAVLDSVPSQIAVLDRNGTIVAVNRVWMNFALENGTTPGVAARNTQVGVNYLAICQATQGGYSPESALLARDGILKVISGDEPSFVLEYPCHSPTQQRWFLLSVTPLRLEEQSVVVTHTDITEHKQLQAARLAQAVEAELAASRQSLREMVALNEATLEEERKYIAREVHDELGQVLTALRMDLSLVGLRYGKLDSALLPEIQGMKTLVDRAIQGVRNVAANLRPTALDMGLVPAIEWLCHEFSRHGAAPCKLSAQEPLVLDDARAVLIFRIVQESLTNTSRYAQATGVGVTLARRGDDLWLEVRDNGCGFDVAAIDRQKSFGLLGMRERAIALGGNLTITSTTSKASSAAPGTVIELTIPCAFENPKIPS